MTVPNQRTINFHVFLRPASSVSVANIQKHRRVVDLLLLCRCIRVTILSYGSRNKQDLLEREHDSSGNREKRWEIVRRNCVEYFEEIERIVGNFVAPSDDITQHRNTDILLHFVVLLLLSHFSIPIFFRFRYFSSFYADPDCMAHT